MLCRSLSSLSCLYLCLQGLNLTIASNVVLCDPWWNPMLEQQAMDRVHRTGQTKAVNVIKLIAGQSHVPTISHALVSGVTPGRAC